MPKALSADQLRRYDEDGFVSPVRVLSRTEAEDLRARMDAFRAEMPEAAGVFDRNPHLLFTWLFGIVNRPAALDALEDVLGPDLLWASSSFRVKEPGQETFAGWHQDAYYVTYDPIWATCLVAITDCTVENGCIRVIPGSHTGGFLDHADLDDERSVLSRGQRIAVPLDAAKAVPIELAAGEAAIFHSLLIHGSEANRSAARRICYLTDIFPARARRRGLAESAILLRGSDAGGNFKRVPPPARDFGPEEFRAHQAAVKARVAGSYQGARWVTPALMERK